MSFADVTDEQRDDAYRAAHPKCAVCERECCESQVFCPSCPIDAPKPIRLSPATFAAPDFACSEACRAAWNQGQKLAVELLDGAVAAAVEEETERVTVACEACGAVLCASKMGVACERAKAVA